MENEFYLKEINLDLKRFRREFLFDEKWVDRAYYKEIKHDALDALILSLSADIYGRDHPERFLVRYPANWWEALKERFGPSWFLYRHPVKFTEVSASVQELYPEIEPPRGYTPVYKLYTHNKINNSPIW